MFNCVLWLAEWFIRVCVAIKLRLDYFSIVLISLNVILVIDVCSTPICANLPTQ